MRNIAKVSTSWLVNAARRSAALKTLYANADISAREFMEAKNRLSETLASPSCNPEVQEESYEKVG